MEDINLKSSVFQSGMSHFLLMAGYKIFSLYFPLFLLDKGFSLPQIGWAYLLTYLPIAIMSPFVGYLNYKIPSKILIVLGIIGYGVYSVGMIVFPNLFVFYALQVFIGLAAAFYFVSFRNILMYSQTQNTPRAFGFFYSAPIYAESLAPVLGAFVINYYGFTGVFALSFLIHLANIVFVWLFVEKNIIKANGVLLKNVLGNNLKIFKRFFDKNIFFVVLLSFAVLVVVGFYRSFFPIFLEEDISFSRETVLFFISLSSVISLPTSYLVLKFMSKNEKKNAIFGGLSFGLTSLIIGSLSNYLGFVGLMAANIIRGFGTLVVNSARSAHLKNIFSREKSEIAGIDTIFSPLGVAVGSLIASFAVAFIEIKFLFIFGGIAVGVITFLFFLSRSFSRRQGSQQKR